MFLYPFSRRRLNNISGPIEQKLLQAVFDWYNARLNFLWTYFDAPSEEEFATRMRREAEFRGVSQESAIVGYVAAIEAKSTSLLQHISVMLALTVFYFATIENSTALRLVLAFEILGYLWTALACLRCLLQISTTEWMRDEKLVGAFDEAFLLEGIKREVIYRHATQVLVFLTLILAAAVLLHAMWLVI